MTVKDELAARLDRVLNVLGNVIDSVAALDPAWEERKKGVEGAYTDALMSYTMARQAFEDETPTMDALAISLKDKGYKDVSMPNGDVDDAQILRSVWNTYHNMIVAGKSFAPDDLIALRTLYAALDRAKKKLTESKASGSSETKFRWSPAMLEGYVITFLKEVKNPTDRKFVAWIAKRAGKPEPSTSTLRKTLLWKNRPKKDAKPRTTNEAQSGVSPDQNADAVGSQEDVINAVLDIEGKLGRQLVDDEREAVAWELNIVGANEEKQKKVIDDLIQGFRSGNM